MSPSAVARSAVYLSNSNFASFLIKAALRFSSILHLPKLLLCFRLNWMRVGVLFLFYHVYMFECCKRERERAKQTKGKHNNIHAFIKADTHDILTYIVAHTVNIYCILHATECKLHTAHYLLHATYYILPTAAYNIPFTFTQCNTMQCNTHAHLQTCMNTNTYIHSDRHTNTSIHTCMHTITYIKYMHTYQHTYLYLQTYAHILCMTTCK